MNGGSWHAILPVEPVGKEPAYRAHLHKARQLFAPYAVVKVKFISVLKSFRSGPDICSRNCLLRPVYNSDEKGFTVTLSGNLSLWPGGTWSKVAPYIGKSSQIADHR